MSSAGNPSVLHFRLSQHPNDHGDTQGHSREDTAAETGPEIQLQMDIDRVLQELCTNVDATSAPTAPATDVLEVAPPGVKVPQRRDGQQHQQHQRQQRGRGWRRSRRQSSSLRMKGRPWEAKGDYPAAVKKVVDGETTLDLVCAVLVPARWARSERGVCRMVAHLWNRQTCNIPSSAEGFSRPLESPPPRIFGPMYGQVGSWPRGSRFGGVES